MQLSERGKTRAAFGTLAVLAIAFEIAILATSEPLPPGGPLAAMLDRGLASIRTGARGAPGMSVAIVWNGSVAYAYAGGYANVATQSKVTPDTRFRAGSIAMQLTAICVMQLVEAGRVDLDATVANYLPSAPHAPEITVRQLLAHTSGLPNITAMAFSTGLVANATTPQRMLAPLAVEPLDFSPGTKYAYGNADYIVLGQIVEALEGRPLADVERDRIFVPAGMMQSSLTSQTAGAPVATDYDDVAGAKPTASFDETWLYGWGDFITTSADLARLDIALMNGKLVGARTFETMRQPVEATADPGVGDGLGFMSDALGTKRLAGHHGGAPGFEADDEMNVKDRFAIVALGNSTQFSTSGVDGLVTAILDPTDFALAKIAATRRTRSR